MATLRTALCALAVLAVCGGAAVAASPAAASTQRVKYLERRLELARSDLADGQARIVAHYEHRIAVKERILEESRICPDGPSQARVDDCRAHAAQIVSELEQELALAKQHRLVRRHLARLEQRIARLERELTTAREAGSRHRAPGSSAG